METQLYGLLYKLQIQQNREQEVFKFMVYVPQNEHTHGRFTPARANAHSIPSP